jgi:UDP-N-acetyl-D-mannosaminuronate dehydrogenase
MMQRAADVGVPAELITAARAVNRTMPLHVATVINEILYRAGVPSGSAKVLMLGWSYKAEVGDPRETPAEPLTEALLSKDIAVYAYDPHIDSSQFPEEVTVVDDITTASGFDLAILVTAHADCVNIDWENLGKRMNNPIIYDGRRVLDLESISGMGWQVHAVGKPQ